MLWGLRCRYSWIWRNIENTFFGALEKITAIRTRSSRPAAGLSRSKSSQISTTSSARTPITPATVNSLQNKMRIRQLLTVNLCMLDRQISWHNHRHIIVVVFCCVFDCIYAILFKRVRDSISECKEHHVYYEFSGAPTFQVIGEEKTSESTRNYNQTQITAQPMAK